MVIMPQKKHRHVSCVDQNDAPSSSANSTPPMGAPHATKSRFSGSVRNSRMRQSCPNTEIDRVPCASAAAMTEPEWIMGPSLPTGSAADTENSTPSALHASVWNRTMRGMLIPFR